MVFCTYCGQSFTRDEHLERHILTHTNVKPFKCLTCHMSFARRDLLQRHYTVHGKDANNQEIVPAADGMIPKSAGRTPIACTNCAKTKTKCDKKYPCTRCAARDLKCTSRPTRRSTKAVVRAAVAPSDNDKTVLPTQTHVGDTGLASPVKSQDSNCATHYGERADEGLSPGEIKSSPARLVAPTRPTSQRPLAMSPPSVSPTNTLIAQQTPQTTLADVPHLSSDGTTDQVPSPRFMLDWTSMQMPLGFDGGVQPHLLMTPDMSFDAAMLSLTPPTDGAGLSIVPNLGHDVAPPLITPPVEVDKFERGFQLSDMACSAYADPRRPLSSSGAHSSAPVNELGRETLPIVAARDGWSCFRCVPTVPSTSCPKTARLHLEQLEQTLKNHDAWTSWTPTWDEAELTGASDHLTVMQLHESTRDKLLAITQSFLHKALEIHRDTASTQDHGRPRWSDGSVSNFVLLPPARVLEYFLRSYANCFEPFYPLTSRGTLDANELMHCYNDRAASLLVLMMIAQGATAIPSLEARMLTGGLTEACRISLFDLIERNIIMSGDPVVLHAALVFTVQAAWSGDKWQMDIAMGQRGMYLAMLRHSSVLEARAGNGAAVVQDRRVNLDHLWTEWIQHESRSSLVYSWAMVDQELALFHDTAPLFSTSEFGIPMPDSERLWHAKSAAEWSSVFEQIRACSGGWPSAASASRPLSLRDLFRRFVDDELVPAGIDMTPLQLRLLLHPLQTLVYQCCQFLSCFSDSRAPRARGPRALSPSSTRARLVEVQSLLQRWFDLAEQYLKANPLCAMMQTNLIIFHLLSLNAVTDFASIEALARRDSTNGSSGAGAAGMHDAALWGHHRTCISDTEEAVFHCGQVLRLVRSMPRAVRPPWWAGAVYRVAMVLWTDSLTRRDAVTSSAGGAADDNLFPIVAGPSFAIDALLADHPLIIRYLTKREGVPCLTKPDGSQMPIDNPFHVLGHCIGLINEGVCTRFSDGIRSKLERLAWT